MKYLIRAFWIILVIGTGCALAMPAISGSGVAWLTVHVQARDAATHQPIPDATVTLMPEIRTQNLERRISSPTVLTAQTDSAGRAIVKDQFGAGFGTWHTSIYIGESRVRCKAPGYLTSQSPLAATPRLRFRDFAIHEQPTSVEVTVLLTRP